MQNMGHKVTLSSGKVVLLRDPSIGDQELAAQAVGAKASDNKFVFAIQLSKEMTRNMIHSVNDKPVTSQDRLSDLLTVTEFNQIQQVVGKLTGIGEDNSPQIEAVNIGGK